MLEELFSLIRIQSISAKPEHKDDIAVFSPGATSFGMFTNEFDRGNKYMKAVKELFK